MKIKHLLLATLAVLSTAALSSCRGGGVLIGVLKFVNVPPLNDAYDGFVAALDEAGIDYDIDLKDANTDSSLVSSSSLELVGENELVLGIATPAASGLLAARTTKGSDVPILFTAVTDPEHAGLLSDSEHPDNNITGTSDMNPVREQIELFTRLGLDIEKIGMIYCSTETNSARQAELAQTACDEFGLTLAIQTFAETGQVAAAMDALIEDGIQGLYTPTDSTLVSSYSTVAEKTNEANIPIIGGEEAHLDLGAVATLSISYFELGKLTGEMAVQIIDGTPITELPIQKLDDTPLILNVDNAEGIGLTFPQELIDAADEVVDEV